MAWLRMKRQRYSTCRLFAGVLRLELGHKVLDHGVLVRRAIESVPRACCLDDLALELRGSTLWPLGSRCTRWLARCGFFCIFASRADHRTARLTDVRPRSQACVTCRSNERQPAGLALHQQSYSTDGTTHRGNSALLPHVHTRGRQHGAGLELVACL